MYRNFNLSWRLYVAHALPVLLLVGSCNLFSASNSSQQTNHDEENGFVQLFDGNTLKGWEGNPAYWRVEDGVLIGETTESTPPLKNNTFLIWNGGEPEDFELITEFRISGQGNSGINYRSDKVDGVPFALRGYQADIDGMNNYTGQNYEERKRTTIAYRGEIVSIPTSADSRAEHNAWTGRVTEGSLGSSDSLKALIKYEDWNECHLIVKGGRLQHFINGVLMSDVSDQDMDNRKLVGLLGIQIHVGPPMKVEYRNFRMKLD